MLVSTTIAKSYICEEVLGVGAFGKVYKVSKTDSGEIFALKEIDESLCLASSMSLTGELDIYPQLQSRYIVNCTRVLRDPEIEHVYLEMEYCNGGTLEEFIMQHRRRQEPIPELQIWEILAQIAAGLAYLHSQIKTGSLSVVVHRDIKPANILFLDDDVKIADFGFCRPLELVSITGSASVQKVLGTPAYLAPEILNGQSCTQKVDIWSLGCIILELCTLEIPTSIADTPIEPYLQQLSGYSNTIKLVIRRCLERIPYARISSADLLLVPDVQEVLRRMEFQRYQTMHNALVWSPSPIRASSPSGLRLGAQSPVSPRPSGFGLQTALMDAALSGDVDSVRNNLHEVRMRSHNGRTALMLAAMAGHSDCIDILLEHEGQMYDNNKMTALMHAARKNTIAEASSLILKESKLQDNKGMTALMHAASAGSRESVERLLAVEEGIRDKDGMTALMHAARNNHHICAKLLAPYEERCHDLTSKTALMYAAINGSKECVSFLLERESGLIDKYGETALMWAVRLNQVEMIHLLIGKEARLSNVEGITALVLAVKLNHVECLDVLKVEAGIQTHSGETALLIAIVSDNISCIQRLALMPQEISARIGPGLTTLMWCILNGKSNYIKWLLPESLRSIDSQGRTALMHASRIGDVSAATVLAEHEHGMQDGEGNTALMYAAEHGHDAIVSLLVNKESRILNSQHRTALMLATDREQRKCCELLAKYEQGHVDSDGRTALIRAVFTGDVELVQLCVGEATYIQANGKTALIIAMERGLSKIVELLGPYEASCRDNEGDTALIWAVKNGKIKYQPYLASAEGLLNRYGKTALKIALDLNKKDMFKALLKGEASIKMPDGYTILDYAVIENKVKYIQCITSHILMERTSVPLKPRVAATVSTKKSPLYLAAESNNLDDIKANLNLIGTVYNGLSSLKIAAYYGHEEAVKLLLGELGLQVGEGFTALMMAAQQGHLGCVELLLGEVGLKTKGGCTALMTAAHEGHLGVVSLLRDFECGATDNNGNTALHYAARCGHTEVLKQLRQEMCIANNLGETALMYAAEEGHIKCVQYLRTEAGMSDVDKSTALLRTLLNGYMGCATILLASEQKISNVTSLMIAAASGDVETAELYIGEASKRDALGRTALMYAARQGHASCVSLLMRYEQGIVDFSGYTALAHSVQAEQLNCVKLLVNEARIPTGFGETVEAMARSQGHMRIARFLRKKPR